MKLPKMSDLREWRKRLGLSQRQVAHSVSIKQPYIAKIENGKANPSYNLVCTLVEFYTAFEDKPKETITSYYKGGVESVEAGEKVSKAVVIMKKRGYSQLPVFSNGRNVGSITENDVYRANSEHGRNKARFMNVELVMGAPFPEFDEETPIEAVLEIFKHTPLILIKKKGEIRGVLTKSDLL